MSSDSAESDENSEWKPEAVCGVIIMCIIFLMLTSYGIFNFKRLYRRIFGSRTTRNQGQRQLVVLEEFNTEDPSVQIQNGGLEISVVHSLPISQFKRSEGNNNVDCAICLGEFEEGEWLKYLSNCTHRFHVSCIDAWFQFHSSCPLCRCYVHHQLSASLQCSVSSHSSLETLRRGN